MAVARVGLVVHEGHPEAVDAARVVRAWCDSRGVRCTDIDLWRVGERRHSAREELDAASDPDLIVTLGGDGTFLRGARLAAENDALVLGVDLGRVGFLTEVPVQDVRLALDAVHEERVTIDSRMLLTMRASCPLELPDGMESLLRYGRGPLLPPPPVRAECEVGGGWGIALNATALNDVVLEKLARDHQVSVGVYLAGRLLASYSADAVMVATPTGSTAYSFAAGGPVISPRAEALVFTPSLPTWPSTAPSSPPPTNPSHCASSNAQATQRSASTANWAAYSGPESGSASMPHRAPSEPQGSGPPTSTDVCASE